MLSRQRLLIVLSAILLTAVCLIAFFFTRRTSSAVAYGPAIAYCPGPDLYGYTCSGGDGYAYIDATNDTRLYDDDALTTLDIPFPFTFYGTTYTSLQASSNGTLHFGDVPYTYYIYDCFTNGPLDDQGNMAAPFWSDLDLRYFGYLETEVVGEAPNRILVVEWDDIPFYGSDDTDTVTFEAQLFEGSNKLVFLYQDVSSDYGARGVFGTVGIQSAANGIAMQYACDQAVIPDSSGLSIIAPDQPNTDIGQKTLVSAPSAPQASLAKGKAADLATRFNQQSSPLQAEAVLADMKGQWLNGRSPLLSDWRWVDLNGDAQKELFILWRGQQNRPDLAQFAILSPDAQGQMTVLEDRNLSSRTAQYSQVRIAEVADVTGDGRSDVILQDEKSGQAWVSGVANTGAVRFLPLAQQCTGGLTVLDANGDGQLDIVRGTCGGSNGRFVFSWNGLQFQEK